MLLDSYGLVGSKITTYAACNSTVHQIPMGEDTREGMKVMQFLDGGRYVAIVGAK